MSAGLAGWGQTAPQISSLDPTQGPVAGGTTVVIRGSGFVPAGTGTPGTRVLFGTTEAAAIQVVSTTDLRVTTPEHANGFVAVAVTTSAGTAVAEFLFVPPTLASLTRGEITTVAGIGKFLAEGRLARDAPVGAADVMVDSAGDVYLSESDYGVIRRIGADGIIRRHAGIGADYAAGDIGDGGPATDATLVFPKGVAVGPDGHIYIADAFNHRIRRIDRSTGTISTVAGSGPVGSCCDGSFAGDGGPALAARFNQPNQVAWDPAGNLYVLDTINHRVRRVATDGTVSTVAGTGVSGIEGDGGQATQAQIHVSANADSGSMKIDRQGNIYLTETNHQRIRKIEAATGIIRTVVGGGTEDGDGVAGTQASVFPRGIALDSADRLLFSDSTRIRRLESDGTVSTIFGTREAGFSPDGTGPGEGRLTSVDRFTVDGADSIVFIEAGSGRVRRIDAHTRQLSTLAGIGPALFGENGPGIAAELINPRQLAVMADDSIIIGGNTILRRLRPDGVLMSIGGGGIIPQGQPPGVRPAVGTPMDAFGVAIDVAGTIFTAGENEFGRIRPDGVYVRDSNGQYGFTGDGGLAQFASVDTPASVILDAAGNRYIADTYNHRIRRVDAITGIITTVAGNAAPHPPTVLYPEISSGDGGPATEAHLPVPNFIVFNAAGDLIVADTDRLRRIDDQGIISTHVSGVSGPFARDAKGTVYCFSSGQLLRIDGRERTTLLATVGGGEIAGDGKPAAQAQIGFVGGMAIDSHGNVFLADSGNRRVRAIKGVVPGNFSLAATAAPQSLSAALGSPVVLSVGDSGGAIQWQRNGANLAGATGASLTLGAIQPAETGIYTAMVTSGARTTGGSVAVGVYAIAKTTGAGTEIAANILHPNLNTFDQILLEGPAASITSDPGQVTRMSYIDLNNDIVQVEFSGPGTLSLVLDAPTGPARPVNYSQPVDYMKGHAGIVIAGADDRTNVTVFTVGRATAYDPTGTYNILLPAGPDNDPASNQSSLFAGHAATSYDGVADLAFLAIASTNGKFGGVRTANCSYFGSKGFTGVFAPGVEFTGPVFIGDIAAFDDAAPGIILGTAADVRITGGDLLQANNQPVEVSGITRLRFVDGSNSHGTLILARPNQARLEENGVDVTATIVVNP